MQNNQTLYKEVTELFSNTANVRNDFTEAYGLMMEHMQKKYVSKLRKAIEKCERKAASNPCPQVSLLQAIKPFASPEAHEKLDGMMSAIQKYNMLLELTNGFGVTSADISIQSLDSSIHNDGVYEVDESCMSQKSTNSAPLSGFAGMMVIMSALNQNRQ